MKPLIKTALYLFHPIWIPFIGAAFYFSTTSQFYPKSIIQAKLWAILVLTLFIPLLILLSLRKIGLIKKPPDKNFKAYRIFLLCLALVIMTINNFILEHEFPNLYLYFTGMLLSLMVIFFLSFIKSKVSLHTTMLSTLLGFVTMVLMFHDLGKIWVFALIILALGWTSTASLEVKQHNGTELFLGILIGVLPQVIFYLPALINL